MQELEPKVQGGRGLYARRGVIAGFYGTMYYTWSSTVTMTILKLALTMTY